MKAKIVAIFIILFLFCGCSTSKEAIVESGPSSEHPSSPVLTVEVDPDPTESSVVTAAPVPENYSQHNEKGPFDDIHYELGKQALDVIDAYLDGDVSLNYAVKILTDCYSAVYDLPEAPQDDPLFAGNDFVKSYIFLAYVDFTYQPEDFDTKKFDDRNYLAAAIGEPEKNFESTSASIEEVDAFLEEIFSKLESSTRNSSFTHYWNEGDLFIFIEISDFDYYFQNKERLSADERSAVLEVSHGYVSGTVAQSLYREIRRVGGYDFDVFIALQGSYGDYCVSRNLQIFIDNLNAE